MGLFGQGRSTRHGLRGLAALARDVKGNTLAIVAAALVPLTAMIGSGVDLSRAYMAQQRLQQACDAASLAGRRVMTGDTLSSTVTTEATKFFNFNFPQGKFQTAAFTPTVTKPDTGVVRVQASTTIPTAVMKIFGYTTLPLKVDCKASLNFLNTDIVLVLDTTGSMDDYVSGTKKIVALRNAVMALYDELKSTQDQLEANGMRLRYGVVPYSSTVNVGKLIYAVNSGYIRNPAPYYQSVCSGSGNNRSCSKQAVSVTHATSPTNWFTSSSWNGCIEERKTVSTITSSTTSIPATAYDLDVDALPTSDDTRWPPYDGTAQQTNTQEACPTQAVRLKAWTRSDMQTYVNSLNPDGGTYHDIGMIWGARFISTGGVFGDSCTSYNSMPCNRYIIFMTDGQLDTGPTLYSAYGVENDDKRVTGGSTSSQDSRHQQRFNLMCSRVKNMNVSIWMVAFATTLSTDMTNCADSGQAFTSADQDDLVSQFTAIGKKIGSLRLTQ